MERRRQWKRRSEVDVVRLMSTKTIPKKRAAPKHTEPKRRAVKNAGPESSLKDLFGRIAERGSHIPAIAQDKLSRTLRESDYCLGSGPVREE